MLASLGIFILCCSALSFLPDAIVLAFLHCIFCLCSSPCNHRVQSIFRISISKFSFFLLTGFDYIIISSLQWSCCQEKWKRKEKKNPQCYFTPDAIHWMNYYVGRKGNGFVLSENCSLMFPWRLFISRAGWGPRFLRYTWMAESVHDTVS